MVLDKPFPCLFGSDRGMVFANHLISDEQTPKAFNPAEKDRLKAIVAIVDK